MLVPTSKKSIPSSRSIIIVGSTGSIGCSTLEIVEANPEQFSIDGLIINSSVDTLLAQVHAFSPAWVGCADCEAAKELSLKIDSSISVHVGEEQILAAIEESQADTVVAAAVGIAGLGSVLAALDSDKKIVLANKESLVAGGSLVAAALKESSGSIVPIDSEHSAMFQALQGEHLKDVRSYVLTASGGPFRGYSKEQLESVTIEQALAHPNWSMGAKISVDSSTLMNKALELIEAHWLFGCAHNDINVVVHPESIIHSLIEYCDGTMIAQLSVPDMKGAIGYGLGYPKRRITDVMKPLNLCEIGSFHFEQVDGTVFPAITMAREVLDIGGIAPAVFNVANEICVEKFLAGQMRYCEILSTVRNIVHSWPFEECATFERLKELSIEVKGKL